MIGARPRPGRRHRPERHEGQLQGHRAGPGRQAPSSRRPAICPLSRDLSVSLVLPEQSLELPPDPSGRRRLQGHDQRGGSRAEGLRLLQRGGALSSRDPPGQGASGDQHPVSGRLVRLLGQHQCPGQAVGQTGQDVLQGRRHGEGRADLAVSRARRRSSSPMTVSWKAGPSMSNRARPRSMSRSRRTGARRLCHGHRLSSH